MYGTAGVSLSKDGPYQRVAVNIRNPLSSSIYLWLSLGQGLAISESSNSYLGYPTRHPVDGFKTCRILLRAFLVRRRIRPGLIEEGWEGEMAFMAKELGRLVARLGQPLWPT